MAKPTVSEVLSLARSLLGDDDTASGDIYTDQILMPHVKSAYRKVYRVMQATDNPYILSEAFYNVPAYTRVLDPAAAGLEDVGEVSFVEERSLGSAVNVAGVSIDVTTKVATVTTAEAHNRVVGDSITLHGIEGLPGLNGLWTLPEIPSPTQAVLGGSYVTTGMYLQGGVFSFCEGGFSPLRKVDLLETTPTRTSGQSLREWQWTGDKIYFLGAMEDRQIKITYTRSGRNLSTLDTLGIDDCADVVAHIAASQAAMGSGEGDAALAANLLSEAMGPQYGRDGSMGGLMAELLQAGVKAMQGADWRVLPFGRPVHMVDQARSYGGRTR